MAIRGSDIRFVMSGSSKEDGTRITDKEVEIIGQFKQNAETFRFGSGKSQKSVRPIKQTLSTTLMAVQILTNAQKLRQSD